MKYAACTFVVVAAVARFMWHLFDDYMQTMDDLAIDGETRMIAAVNYWLLED